MPGDESDQSTTTWPLPKFRFEVTIGAPVALKGIFQEVSGLSSEAQVIEYRAGTSPQFSTVKMPGIKKTGNVTLKKGIFQDDKGFWALQGSIAQNTIKRQTIVIELLDETGASTMKWTLGNAFPTKITSTDMKTDGGEVAVETIELAFETLTLKAA
jgi:phage tail-like protein